jgi:GNAT superfamily N-acetyltransferase
MSIIFRPISHTELDALLPPLVELLREAVNGGAGLGFLPPLTHDDSRDYWLSLRPELQAGSRLLLAAFTGGRLAGSGQLTLPPWTNGRHRAEIQKVFVAAAVRGRGVGRSLMSALHDAARQRGRSLVLLNARRGGSAESFYRRLGYKEVGVVPGFAVGAAGERYDNVSFYQELACDRADRSIAGASST